MCPQSLASEGEEEEPPEEEEEEAPREGRVPVPVPEVPKKPEERSKKQQGKSLVEPAGTGELGGGSPGGPGQHGRGDGNLSSLSRSREKAGGETPSARSLLHPGDPRLGQVGDGGPRGAVGTGGTPGGSGDSGDSGAVALPGTPRPWWRSRPLLPSTNSSLSTWPFPATSSCSWCVPSPGCDIAGGSGDTCSQRGVPRVIVSVLNCWF